MYELYSRDIVPILFSLTFGWVKNCREGFQATFKNM